MIPNTSLRASQMLALAMVIVAAVIWLINTSKVKKAGEKHLFVDSEKGQEDLSHSRCHGFDFIFGKLDFFTVLCVRLSLIRDFEGILEIVGIFTAVAIDVHVAVDVDGYVHG